MRLVLTQQNVQSFQETSDGKKKDNVWILISKNKSKHCLKSLLFFLRISKLCLLNTPQAKL